MCTTVIKAGFFSIMTSVHDCLVDGISLQHSPVCVKQMENLTYSGLCHMKSKPSRLVVNECASLFCNTYEMCERTEQWYSALTYFRA